MKLTITLDYLDENLIKFYESNQSSKIKDALCHGFQIVNSSQYALNLNQEDSQAQSLLQDLEQIKQDKLEIQQKHQVDLEEKEQDFRGQKNRWQLQLSEIQSQQFQTRLDLEKQIKLESQELLSKLESKNECLTLEKDKLNQQIITTHMENYQNLDRITQQHKLEVEGLQMKLDERTSILSNSSKKGKEGEMRMLDLLNELFPQAEITETHHTTANGDFRIVIHGIQILYENKNFQNNVPKRDIEKFKRDVDLSDCDCGIMCSENSGIAGKNDLDMEIIGKSEKPTIYLHQTNTNLDKIKIAILILVNILENKLDLNTSTLLEIKNQVKDCESILTIYNSNKKQITGLQQNNENLAVNTRRIKFRLDNIIQELSNNHKSNKKIKERCEYCSKSYVDLQKHYPKCEKKNNLTNAITI